MLYRLPLVQYCKANVSQILRFVVICKVLSRSTFARFGHARSSRIPLLCTWKTGIGMGPFEVDNSRGSSESLMVPYLNLCEETNRLCCQCPLLLERSKNVKDVSCLID